MPSSKLAAPTNFVWNDTTVSWTEDVNAAGFDIDVYYSATDANATSTDNLERLGGLVWYYGESGDTNASTNFASRYMEEPGYYYVAVSSVSNDIAKNWHSDAALSSAYAYDTDSGETNAVPAVSTANWSNGYLRINFGYEEGTDISPIHKLKVEVSEDGTNWITFCDEVDRNQGSIDVSYSAIRYNVPAGHYTKIRFTSIAESGYTDASSEFNMDLTITRSEDQNYKVTFTSEEEEGYYTVSADLGEQSEKLDEGGICSGVVYTYSEDNKENYGMDTGTAYFSYYNLGEESTTVTVENKFLPDPYWYVMYMLSETVSAEKSELTTTKNIALTDLSGWKECFPEAEPGTDITIEANDTIEYTVDGNTVTVTQDTPCKVGYLADGKYVAITATANENGGYDFVVPEDVTDIVIVKNGDVNGDGSINVGDLSLLNAILIGKEASTELADFVADANGDGKVNAGDASRMNAVLLGKAALTW